MSIPSQLNDILSRIRQAEQRSERPVNSARLIAVSKTFPAEDVVACYEAGQRDFGENKVQEGIGKMPKLPQDTRWHLIGPLQRNKVRKALEHFHLIHAVDSLRLARFIDTVAQERGVKAHILLEVNIGAEESKFGFTPQELSEAMREVDSLHFVSVDGLMCIPPSVDTPEEARPYFRALRELRDEVAAASGQALPELSMGMSHDFEIAVEEGATLVRVGTAIFGGRSYPTKLA